MNKICYFCGEPATSREHSPPKCIFPRAKDSADQTDYRNNLIVVPSCDIHNTAKSTDDEYLLYILTMSIASNRVGGHHFLFKVYRAITRRPKLLERIMIEHEYVTAHDTINNTWHKTLAFKVDDKRLNSVFTHIAKAIYFNEFQDIWNESVNILPEFTLSFSDIKKNQLQEAFINEVNSFLSETPRKGNNQDAFYYQVRKLDGKTVMRLCFYENSKVTITSKQLPTRGSTLR